MISKFKNYLRLKICVKVGRKLIYNVVYYPVLVFFVESRGLLSYENGNKCFYIRAINGEKSEIKLSV